MNKEEMVAYKNGIEKGVDSMHKEIYGHWRHPNDMNSIRDGYDSIKKLVEVKIEEIRQDVIKLEEIGTDKEYLDIFQNKIYNMKQVLKFVNDQFNQIPQMTSQEIEIYEATLEALN